MYKTFISNDKNAIYVSLWFFYYLKSLIKIFFTYIFGTASIHTLVIYNSQSRNLDEKRFMQLAYLNIGSFIQYHIPLINQHYSFWTQRFIQNCSFFGLKRLTQCTKRHCVKKFDKVSFCVLCESFKWFTQLFERLKQVIVLNVTRVPQMSTKHIHIDVWLLLNLKINNTPPISSFTNEFNQCRKGACPFSSSQPIKCLFKIRTPMLVARAR